MGKPEKQSRRKFLKRALIGGGAAAVAAASGGAIAAPSREEKPLPTTAPESQGYRETPHVQQYYKTAQF